MTKNTCQDFLFVTVQGTVMVKNYVTSVKIMPLGCCKQG